MKALILSGGKGTRLRPITHTSAKQLVPIANKPVLFYAIEGVAAAGIRDVGIVTGETGDEIRAACGSGKQWGVDITYIPQSAPLGIAHAVKIAQPFLGAEPFLLYLGDNLVTMGIAEFVHEFEQSNDVASLLLAHVPNPQEFGVAELDGSRVSRLVEKPAHPKSDLALVGVYLFRSAIFDAVDSIVPSARGELEITEAIQRLIDGGQPVKFRTISGYWKDTGKLDDLLEANRLVLETLQRQIDGDVDAASRIVGNVHLSAGCVVRNSVIRGPVIIGGGTVIDNAYVGPFSSISSGCTIRGCELEHSIVLENSSIEDTQCRLEDSLIGRNVRVYRTESKPKAYRLMVGDNSEAGLISPS